LRVTYPSQPPAAAPTYPQSDSVVPPTDETAEGPDSSTAERLVYVAVCVVAGLVAALPAAWLWVHFADPPSTTFTQGSISFGEVGFDGVSSITFWFLVIGFVFGLGIGLVAAWFGRRHGIITVIAILLSSLIGTALMYWFGVHLFGPEHPVDFVALFNADTAERARMLASYSNGDKLVSSLNLTSNVALLGWPIGAMIGTLVAAYFWPKVPKSQWMPPT